tara:strand:- start:3 stop:185 length:183 start_codon:yes stop_codon:yes gene_type:complete
MANKKVKIDYDINSKVKVRIAYEGDSWCSTFYNLECEELTKELLNIMKNGYDVEVTKNQI